MSNTSKYVTLSGHKEASGEVIPAGTVISLTPAQAGSRVGTVRLVEVAAEVADPPVDTKELDAKIIDLTTKLNDTKSDLTKTKNLLKASGAKCKELDTALKAATTPKA